MVFEVIRSWTAFRGVVEIISTSEISFAVLELITSDEHPSLRALNGSPPDLALTNLSVVGLSLFSQILFLHLNFMHSTNSAPHFAKILAFQGMVASFLISMLYFLDFLHFGLFLLAPVVFIICLSAYISASRILNSNPSYDLYKNAIDEIEPYEERRFNLPRGGFPFFLLKGLGMCSGILGLLLLFFPQETNGAINTLFVYYDLPITQRTATMVALLSVVNFSQGAANLFAAWSGDLQYIGATAETGYIGFVFAVLGYLGSSEGHFSFALALKYSILYVWYSAQMSIIWPKSREQYQD